MICFLGPLQVDVSDNNSGSEASSHEDKPTNNKSKNSRLLQECSSSGADVNQNSKDQTYTGKKRGRKPKNKNKTANDDLSDAFSPNSTCESPIAPEFDELNDVDGTELNHQDMEFSFERTPHREGWFQAYSRQDLGDEILYFSDHQFFPLPYEMPMSTFLPWRSKQEKSGKKSTKNTPEASGTATPINIAAEDEDSNYSSTPMRATRACKSNKKNLNEASFFDKIDPKKAAALRAADLFSRKSPRGHASTKSLLNNATSPYVEDDEYFEELLQNDQSRLAYLDECSMDSELSASRLDNRGEESIGELIEIANRLDAFFCEEDPLPTSEKKRSRRQSSSELQNKSKRSGRRSKDSHHDQADNGLDKIVNSHVDPVFLDCLEDELPSVTFDDPIRSNNDPMKWINTYDQCTSINLFSKKNKKFSQKHIASNSTPASEEKIKKERDSSLENESLVISHSKDAASATILRRLLTDSGSKNNSKSTKNNRPLIKPKLIADDSSSECASISESVASSNSARRKKKRNMTGFPSPKKKKKLITPALTPKAGLNKRLGRKAKEIEEASTSTRKTKKTNKSTSRAGVVGTSRTVQMQLKLNKNGISLQKPTKQQSPHKTGKRGRPPLKSKHHSKQTQQTNKKSRTSSSSVVPKHSQKSKPAINPAEVIDIVSSSPDDDDDDTTYGSKSGKNGKRKNKKKKRKRLCLKQRKKFLLVKPGSKPKVITLDSDDNIDQVPDSASESEDNETENDDKNSNTSDEDSNDEEQGNDSSAEEASEAGDESEKTGNSSDESGSGSGSGEEEEDEEDIPISRQAAMKKQKTLKKEIPKPKLRYKTVTRKRRKF